MKTQSFFHTFCLFALVLGLLTFTTSSTLFAQGINAPKICYEKGTVATGGAVCSGTAGAVPGGASIEISDGKGGTATGTANADGSFFIPCGNLSAGLGQTVTVKVNGACIQVQVVFSCGGSDGNNATPSTSTGNSTGNGAVSPNTSGGTSTTPTPVTPGGTTGNNTTGVGTGTGGANAGNGNPGGANNNAAIDCSRIAYVWRGASVGGPVCVGRPGAVPAGATVTVRDSKGNTVSGTAEANGSFGINCSDLVGAVGQTVTVSVNGVDCVVTISSRGR